MRRTTLIPYGVDPSCDVDLAECRCGPAGHRLLTACYERQSGIGPSPSVVVSNGEITVSRAVRQELRRSGLVFLVEGREGGWPASWWTVRLTPAGLRHAAQLAGEEDRHGGPGGCGAAWSADRRCTHCLTRQPLTIGLAVDRIEAMPAGPERDREIWASRFVCVYHGRCRMDTVRTDKCCAICGDGLNRHLDPDVTPAAPGQATVERA